MSFARFFTQGECIVFVARTEPDELWQTRGVSRYSQRDSRIAGNLALANIT